MLLPLTRLRPSGSFLYPTRRSLFTTPKVHAPRFRLASESRPNKVDAPPLLITTLRSRSAESLEQVSYLRPLIFGSIFCAGTFIVAGIKFDQNQQTVWQRWRARLGQGWSPLRRRRQQQQSNEDDEQATVYALLQERYELILEQRQAWMDRMANRLERWQQVYGLPLSLRRMGLMVASKYASMTESERTLAGLIGINILVFGAWQVPRWTPFMARWFMHHPGSRTPITLITSCFSHKEGLHLAFNMVGLWSFGGLMHDYLGREQFFALYLSTGVGANMASHVLSLAFRRSRPLLPSLGASGAIYGLLSGTAYLKPEASVSLIFLPWIPIKLGYALPAMMGFDVAGILLKWKMFDHYAHLAGASIGLGYMAYGQQYLWQPLIKNIHDIRSKQSSN